MREGGVIVGLAEVDSLPGEVVVDVHEPRQWRGIAAMVGLSVLLCVPPIAIMLGWEQYGLAYSIDIERRARASAFVLAALLLPFGSLALASALKSALSDGIVSDLRVIPQARATLLRRLRLVLLREWLPLVLLPELLFLLLMLVWVRDAGMHYLFKVVGTAGPSRLWIATIDIAPDPVVTLPAIILFWCLMAAGQSLHLVRKPASSAVGVWIVNILWLPWSFLFIGAAERFAFEKGGWIVPSALRRIVEGSTSYAACAWCLLAAGLACLFVWRLWLHRLPSWVAEAPPPEGF